jgi:hypothetical protein
MSKWLDKYQGGGPHSKGEDLNEKLAQAIAAGLITNPSDLPNLPRQDRSTDKRQITTRDELFNLNTIPATQDNLPNLQPFIADVPGASVPNFGTQVEDALGNTLGEIGGTAIELLGAPQKLATMGLTGGEYSLPSEAINAHLRSQAEKGIGNAFTGETVSEFGPVGSTIIDMLLDPANLLGLGVASKAGKVAKGAKILRSSDEVLDATKGARQVYAGRVKDPKNFIERHSIAADRVVEDPSLVTIVDRSIKKPGWVSAETKQKVLNNVRKRYNEFGIKPDPSIDQGSFDILSNVKAARGIDFAIRAGGDDAAKVLAPLINDLPKKEQEQILKEVQSVHESQKLLDQLAGVPEQTFTKSVEPLIQTPKTTTTPRMAVPEYSEEPRKIATPRLSEEPRETRALLDSLKSIVRFLRNKFFRYYKYVRVKTKYYSYS